MKIGLPIFLLSLLLLQAIAQRSPETQRSYQSGYTPGTNTGVYSANDPNLRTRTGEYQTAGTTSTRGVRPEYSQYQQNTAIPANHVPVEHSGYAQVPQRAERVPTGSVIAEPLFVAEPLYGEPYIAGVEEFIEPGRIIEPAHPVTSLTGERLSSISALPGPDAHLPQVNSHQDRREPIVEELLLLETTEYVPIADDFERVNHPRGSIDFESYPKSYENLFGEIDLEALAAELFFEEESAPSGRKYDSYKSIKEKYLEDEYEYEFPSIKPTLEELKLAREHAVDDYKKDLERVKLEAVEEYKQELLREQAVEELKKLLEAEQKRKEKEEFMELLEEYLEPIAAKQQQKQHYNPPKTQYPRPQVKYAQPQYQQVQPQYQQVQPQYQQVQPQKKVITANPQELEIKAAINEAVRAHESEKAQHPHEGVISEKCAFTVKEQPENPPIQVENNPGNYYAQKNEVNPNPDGYYAEHNIIEKVPQKTHSYNDPSKTYSHNEPAKTNDASYGIIPELVYDDTPILTTPGSQHTHYNPTVSNGQNYEPRVVAYDDYEPTHAPKVDHYERRPQQTSTYSPEPSRISDPYFGYQDPNDQTITYYGNDPSENIYSGRIDPVMYDNDRSPQQSYSNYPTNQPTNNPYNNRIEPVMYEQPRETPSYNPPPTNQYQPLNTQQSPYNPPQNTQNYQQPSYESLKPFDDFNREEHTGGYSSSGYDPGSQPEYNGGYTPSHPLNEASYGEEPSNTGSTSFGGTNYNSSPSSNSGSSSTRPDQDLHFPDGY